MLWRNYLKALSHNKQIFVGTGWQTKVCATQHYFKSWLTCLEIIREKKMVYIFDNFFLKLVKHVLLNTGYLGKLERMASVLHQLCQIVDYGNKCW